MTEQEIFFQAIELGTADQRDAYLRGACGNDAALRRRVDALLAEHYATDSLLAGSAVEIDTIIEHQAPTEGPGARIGRYKLLQKIGEGGMGVVYMAEQTEPVTRKVALKIIKLGMDTRQVVARFEAERQALAMMDHPNIARVLDAGATDSGRPYFVMELVQGVPITEFCDKNKLSTRRRLELFMPVCHAIQHAHQKGVIHRDIKPSNVMVTLNDGVPHPMVIDFGIAKATNQKLTERTLFTHYAQMIGTPAYMSPEQAEMSKLDVDTRTDIYSLGVLLYEILTGTTPFSSRELLSKGYGEMQRIIAEREPARPSILLSTLQDAERSVLARNRSMEASALGKVFQGDLDSIVMKALEKDRQRRYDTANGLAADIQRHLSNEPVIARPPSVAYRFQKAWRRNRVIYSAGLLVAVLLVAGVIGTSFGLQRATRERQAALEAATVADTANQAAQSAREQEAARSQELKQNLYFQSVALAHQEVSENRPAHALKLLEDCPADLRGWEWNHVRNQSVAGNPPVTHFQEPVYSLALGPNGRDIALIVGETLRLAELTPGGTLQRTKILATTPRPFSEIAPWISFSPDSRFLATAITGGTVTIWDVADRKPAGSFQGSSNRINVIAFHPSGRQVAVVSSKTYGLTATIDLFETPGGRLIRRIQQGTSVFSMAFSPDG